MDRKNIQEQRMKAYFIEAAKKILRGEGFRNISVRNIANEAGYSYATLYNYFKDLREVLYFALLDFMEECRQFTLAGDNPKLSGKERIKKLTKAYCNYFVQYPGIFELLFTERIQEISSQERISNAAQNLFEDIFSPVWIVIEKDTGLNPEMEIIKLIHKHTVHSVIMFYVLRRTPSTYKEFIEKVELIIDGIL